MQKWKDDQRPAITRYGWAPGDYLCKCYHCKEQFIGDKRATSCADCAYEAKEKRDARDWIDL